MRMLPSLFFHLPTLAILAVLAIFTLVLFSPVPTLSFDKAVAESIDSVTDFSDSTREKLHWDPRLYVLPPTTSSGVKLLPRREHDIEGVNAHSRQLTQGPGGMKCAAASLGRMRLYYFSIFQVVFHRVFHTSIDTPSFPLREVRLVASSFCVRIVISAFSVCESNF